LGSVVASLLPLITGLGVVWSFWDNDNDGNALLTTTFQKATTTSPRPRVAAIKDVGTTFGIREAGEDEGWLLLGDNDNELGRDNDCGGGDICRGGSGSLENRAEATRATC
jgi:hypothetical protein